MIDLAMLAAPMSGDGCCAELFREGLREQLRAACDTVLFAILKDE